MRQRVGCGCTNPVNVRYHRHRHHHRGHRGGRHRRHHGCNPHHRDDCRQGHGRTCDLLRPYYSHHLVRCQDRLRRHLEQRLSSPSHIILNLDTLAAAHAEAGRFDDTIKTQQRTIDRTKSEKWDGILFGQRSLLNMLSYHLNLFRAGKPIRGGVY